MISTWQHVSASELARRHPKVELFIIDTDVYGILSLCHI